MLIKRLLWPFTLQTLCGLFIGGVGGRGCGELLWDKDGKRLGISGLPWSWYMHYIELLIPHLLRVYGYALKTGQLLLSMSDALIVLIPKSHKNHLLWKSYRPISLINLVIKIVINKRRACCPTCWTQPNSCQSPGWENWVRRVNQIKEAEDWITTYKSTQNRFTRT